VSEPVDEIAIARRARDATAENAELREQIGRLTTRLDELRRFGTSSVVDGTGEAHGPRCMAVAGGAPGGAGTHPLVTLDRGTRAVTCRHCKAHLDAFDVLVQYSTAERRFNFQIQALREERKKLTTEIEDLKKQRRNAMAANRRNRTNHHG
jgi:hypothetical protein